MAIVTVDGFNIDTTIWIDAQLTRFKDRKIPWAFRRHTLLKEIEDYKGVLRDFGTVVPHDIPGEAHTKAYISALEQTNKEIMQEITQGR